MPTTAQLRYTCQGLTPSRPWPYPQIRNMKLAASTTYVAGQVLGEKTGTDSIQTVTIGGAPTGGTFTLTFGAQTTTAIPFGASSDTIKFALEALSTIGVGNVKVTAVWVDTGATIRIEFIGTLGNAAQTAVTCSIASLTGGTATQSVAQTQVGATGSIGTMAKYLDSNTDGSGIAKGLLQYSCTTDASGNITGPGGEWSETVTAAPVMFSGFFMVTDLTGLTMQALSDMAGSIVVGTLAGGEICIRGS